LHGSLPASHEPSYLWVKRTLTYIYGLDVVIYILSSLDESLTATIRNQLDCWISVE